MCLVQIEQQRRLPLCDVRKDLRRDPRSVAAVRIARKIAVHIPLLRRFSLVVRRAVDIGGTDDIQRSRPQAGIFEQVSRAPARGLIAVHARDHVDRRAVRFAAQHSDRQVLAQRDLRACGLPLTVKAAGKVRERPFVRILRRGQQLRRKGVRIGLLCYRRRCVPLPCAAAQQRAQRQQYDGRSLHVSSSRRRQCRPQSRRPTAAAAPASVSGQR